MENNDKKIKNLYAKLISAPAIALELKVPLNQVYNSLKRQSVVRRTTAEQNKLRYERCAPSYSWKKPLTSKEKQLLVAGVMLYYGEGAKTQQTVDFANSDQHALALFLKFLKDICRVDQNRLRFYLYCFQGQDPESLIDFWCKRLSVDHWQFTKPYVRYDRANSKRIMSYGVLHIRYSDKKLLRDILFLINKITNELS